MQLVLTQTDLDAMPAALREQLFSYLGGFLPGGGHHAIETAELTRDQAIGLLREISFHRAGARLHTLLERLAYTDAAQPPTRERLARALEADGEHLGRYLGFLNRITAKVTGRPGARLYDHSKEADAYTVPEATRAVLREVLAAMKASGEQEEPPWTFWDRGEAS
ncbi:MAG: hypothetical protein B7Z80_20855 [Rhodospirillales bacterium 20-64-7]|nr:MAG: hypothetical protein B7Z80_20855 [Rhodospirillales bacterium 20-64-7]HQT77906.1 hypothetical protein [Rhodopila sp.]